MGIMSNSKHAATRAGESIYLSIYLSIEDACGGSSPALAFGDLWLIRQSGLSQAAFLKSLDELFGFRVMELKMKHVGLQNPIKNMKASIKMGSKINEKSNKQR